jgi:RNA polymerase sigma factor (sigma-70 family)
MSTDPVVASSNPNRANANRGGVDRAYADQIAQLFEAEYPKLVHYLVARTRSWAEARDVASQAFAQVLEVQNPQAVSFLKGYVYQAAKNIWTDRCKIKAIRTRIDHVARYDIATTSPSPEPLLGRQQRAEVLRKAIDGLKASRKMVLIWRIWDELTYREIASRLAEEGIMVDERTASNWCAEALEKLGETVKGLAEDLEAEEFE